MILPALHGPVNNPERTVHFAGSNSAYVLVVTGRIDFSTQPFDQANQPSVQCVLSNYNKKSELHG